VQVGGQWPGASDGVGTGLDFDGAVAEAGVIGAHLPLLLASDQIFHRVKSASINFSESFARLFEVGIADGSLTPPGGDPRKRPSWCLNAVCWSYVQLRDRHRWPTERAGHGLRRLMTPGLMTMPGSGTRRAGS
jgi:hypothetical protein